MHVGLDSKICRMDCNHHMMDRGVPNKLIFLLNTKGLNAEVSLDKFQY